MTDQHPKPVRTYLAVLCLFIVLSAIIGGLNYTYLLESHEFEPLDEVVKMQLQNGGLYLSSLHNTIHCYKLAIYRAVKPKIAVLGSSRVWQIRGRYFNAPFVNLGGAVQSLIEVKKALAQIAASHKPEVLLLHLDPWWFGSYGKSLVFQGDYPDGSEFRLDLVYLPCHWLLERKISLGNYCQTLAGREENPFPAMGVFAAVNREGFYHDGSFYDYGKVFGLCKGNGIARFANEEFLIKNGMEIFTYDRTINPERWAEFVSLMQYAEAQNIRVITFLGPLPARILDWIAAKGENYAYLDELRARIPEVSPHHFDFFEPREFGSSDCEFLDGLHPGEIASLRMLRAMGRDPDSGLGPYLKRPLIEASIRQFAGKAIIPIHSFGRRYKEIDFLQLGCNKN